MNSRTTKKQLLTREGQTQSQRFPRELDSYYIKIDDKTRKELLLYAAEISKEINFYSESTNTIDGTWTPFFEKVYDKSIAKLKDYGKHEPHLALYLTFLLIYRHAQKSINGITKRHLDFYYKEILKLSNKKETPDKVHVLFELKKGVDESLIKAGTYLDAGKDLLGNKLHYKTQSDIIVSNTSVSKIKSVFVDKKKEKINKITIAPIAKSSDGLGEELNDGESWSPFGDSKFMQGDIGLGLASKILLLSEGKRLVRVHINTLSSDTLIASDFNLEAYFTGEKGWIGPVDCSLESSAKESGHMNYVLLFELKADEEAVKNYSSKVHGGTYETDNPFMQILLKKDTGTYSYEKLSKLDIKSIKLSVEVTNIKELDLENDQGKINCKKPFMPFGTEPAEGSSFYIGSEEIFSKNIDSFTLHVNWKNIPGDYFNTYYAGYTDKNGSTVTGNSYFSADLIEYDTVVKTTTVKLFGEKASDPVTIVPESIKKDIGAKIISQPLNYTKVATLSSKWAVSQITKLELTSKVINTGTKKDIPAQLKLSDKIKKTYVQLKLKKSFLHQEYRKYYTKTVVEFAKNKDAKTITLPNEPYTPEMESLTLDYKSSTRVEDLTSANESYFLKSEVEFFQITPFGQRREHAFIKSKLGYSVNNSITLLHEYENAGEMYIGIKNVEAQSEVPLLFQLAEGSADPEKEKANLQWSVLADNHWKDFTDTEIVSDTTNNLLTSGIIKFTLPKEATNKDTLLESGYYWIRTFVKDEITSVCRFIDVASNACLAEFVNKGNELSHLKTSLPAKSIKKLLEPVTTIKKITQPYASFSGSDKESDRSFYTRVSERLRHKNRAITIWDYERLILQNFPNVQKVKAIPHCSGECEYAPGNVTLVVIPNLANKNAVNKLQPKVDLNTIEEISEFIKEVTGYFVKVNVQNPDYEQIVLDFKVKMRKGYPYGYYSNVLQQDIIKYLCPWLSDESEEISFEGTIHKSVLLNFIEKRKYVDYLTDFKMYKLTKQEESTITKSSLSKMKDINSANVTSSRSILVSAEEHYIASI